jgi:hypothetical protein
LLTDLFTRAIDTPDVLNEDQTVVESKLSVRLGGIYVESIEDAIRAYLSVVDDELKDGEVREIEVAG